MEQQQLSIFDLDEYEQRALILRTVIMRRKHAEPLTPLLISMLARAWGPPAQRITHVLTDLELVASFRHRRTPAH
jgi:hypothetical protein